VAIIIAIIIIMIIIIIIIRQTPTWKLYRRRLISPKRGDVGK